jgi:hypothetical protein
MYGDYATTTGSGPGIMATAYAWFAIFAIYIYFAFMMYKIAQKTGHSPIAWWAFIPILNTFLLIKMAHKPLWWFVLLLVPFVNIIAFFVLWMSVAKVVGQSQLWGFLAMIPILNFVALFVLAYNSRPVEYPKFSEETEPKPKTPQQVG